MRLSLMRSGPALSGLWTLRTGGGGPFSGVLDAGGQRLRMHMEDAAPECPGTFDGWAELSGTTLTGAYQGRDCEGPVANGRLELHAQ